MWHSIALKVATYALAFLLGTAFANHWATRSAIQAVQANANAQYAADTAALAKEVARREEVAKKASERAKAANEEAQMFLDMAMDAEKRHDAALLQIAKDRNTLSQLKGNIDDLKTVNTMLATPPDLRMVICGSADTRRLLDAIATGEAPDPASTGDSETDSSRASPGTPLVSPNSSHRLTCDQLLRGYPEMARDDARLRVLIEAWQGWYREAFK